MFFIFQSIFKTFKLPTGLTDTIIVEWESNGLPNQKIKHPITANHSLSPGLRWMNNSRIRLEFKENYLKQDKTTFTKIIYRLCTRYMVTKF